MKFKKKNLMLQVLEYEDKGLGFCTKVKILSISYLCNNLLHDIGRPGREEVGIELASLVGGMLLHYIVTFFFIIFFQIIFANFMKLLIVYYLFHIIYTI
jgi:hypothetical protein